MALTPIKLQFLRSLGDFWTEIFEDTDAVNSVALACATYLQPYTDYTQDSADYVSVDDIPPFIKENVVIYVFLDRVFVDENGIERRESATARVSYNGERSYGDGTYYGEYIGTDSNTYAVDSTRAPAYLGTTLDGADVLVKDVDYVVQGDTIDFKRELAQITSPVEILADSEGETVYVYQMWGFAVDYDIQAVQKMFGMLTRVYGPSGEDYKEAVRLAWDLQVIGANAINTDRVCCFLSGVDHYDGPGNELISNVFDEAGYTWVETDSGVYGAPEGTALLVSLGDLLDKGAQLFDVYDIYAGRELPAADRITGLVLSKGFLGPEYEDTLYIENAFVDTAVIEPANWYYVETDGGTAYNVKDEDGHIIKTVGTDTEATALVQQIPDNIWVYGPDSYYESPQVYQFMLWLNTTGFFDDLAERYGRVPGKINPMAELRDYLFGPNMTIIAVDLASGRQDYVSQLVSVLSRTWPAGSTFVFYAIPPDYEDIMTAEFMTESYDLFYAMETEDTQEAPVEFVRAGRTLTKPSGGV